MSTYNRDRSNDNTNKWIGMGIIGGIIGGIGLFAANRYHIAMPNQLLIRNGLFSKSNVPKRAVMQWPLQTVYRIDLTPRNIHIELKYMTSQKIEFKMPINYIIGPYHYNENPELFKQYTERLYDASDSRFASIISSAVDGDIRSQVANMTVEQLFSDKEKFRTTVTNKIQMELDKMGVKIYNANISELTDSDENNKYFAFLKKKAIESANNMSAIEVAHANKLGEIGIKQNQVESRMRTAEQETLAKLVENDQRQLVIDSNTRLEVNMAENMKRQQVAVNIANIETEQHKAELMKILAEKQREQHIEELKSTDLTKTIVEAEQQIKAAEGKARSTILLAEAESSTIEMLANANYYKRVKEAEGIQKTMEAQSIGLREIYAASGNNYQLTMYYIGKDKLIMDVANAQANAVKDMKPTVHIWNTGSDASTDTITKTVQSLVPLASTIMQQTGLGDMLKK